MANPNMPATVPGTDEIARRVEAARAFRYEDFANFQNIQRERLAPELGSLGTYNTVELLEASETTSDRVFVQETLGNLATGMAAGLGGGAPELREQDEFHTLVIPRGPETKDNSQSPDSTIEIISTSDVPADIIEAAQRQSMADAARLDLERVRFEDEAHRATFSQTQQEPEGSRVAAY